ncbi:MAG: hypothetical protein A2X64_01895 [Ignavibacteria bacterium GWF2_33_9]|nr:MAG: hypothetical protein A2X64_01895 [Ignavibacteria bacterium GWF2_33_9]
MISNVKYYILFLIFIPLTSFSKGFRYDTLANDLKCLTFHQNSQKNLIQKKVDFNDSTSRPDNQQVFISEQGNFWIHYDISGLHAVNLYDANLNGIPDYIDSVAYYAEYVYQKEVLEMGFLSPLGDSLLGGSDAYDIYIFDIGDSEIEPDPNEPEGWGGTYGFTVSETEIKPSRKYQRYTSFMVLDNNYSETDSVRVPGGKHYIAYKTFGLEGAKITLAHEFQHAIQFRYGLDYTYSSGFAEMCSVMFENLIFPESEDYLQYVRSLFKFPELYNFSMPMPENGYRYGIFTTMLQQKYGIDVIKKMWELTAQGITTYKCIDSALHLEGSSLDEEWIDFLHWIYYSGERTIPGKYFIDASKFPTFSFFLKLNYSEPSVNFSSNLDPYQIQFDEVVFPNKFPHSNDTLVLLATNLNLNQIVNGIYSKSSFSIIIKTIYDGAYIRLFPDSEIPYYYGLLKGSEGINVIRIEKPGIETYKKENAYPNPLHIALDENLFVPAPGNAGLGSKITFQLLDENAVSVYNSISDVDIHNSNRIIKLPVSELKSARIKTGVYIYKVDSDDETIFGKIAIINP